MVWGAQCACTFFRRPFLQEKRGLEFRNFLTFPDSENERKIDFSQCFGFNLEGAGTFCLPLHSSYIQKPRTIRVNLVKFHFQLQKNEIKTI